MKIDPNMTLAPKNRDLAYKQLGILQIQQDMRKQKSQDGKDSLGNECVLQKINLTKNIF